MRLRIREWRQHFQLSQATLAAESGLSRETISAIENDHQTVNIHQLEALASALHLRVSDLLDERPCPHCPYRQGPPPPEEPPDPEALAPVLRLHRGGEGVGDEGGVGVHARSRAAIRRARQVQAQARMLLAHL